MPVAAEVRIHGLRELQRALAKINREVAGDVREELRKAAEPVRADAEHRAFSTIRNIGAIWGRMRTGITLASVYVAPATRRRGGSARPNFGTLLMEQAMLPALEDNQESILGDVTDAFDRLTRSAGFH